MQEKNGKKRWIKLGKMGEEFYFGMGVAGKKKEIWEYIEKFDYVNLVETWLDEKA